MSDMIIDTATLKNAVHFSLDKSAKKMLETLASFKSNDNWSAFYKNFWVNINSLGNFIEIVCINGDCQFKYTLPAEMEGVSFEKLDLVFDLKTFLNALNVASGKSTKGKKSAPEDNVLLISDRKENGEYDLQINKVKLKTNMEKMDHFLNKKLQWCNMGVKTVMKITPSNVEPFLEQLNKVKPAISKEETRYYLNGIYFDHHLNDRISLVATDGHRLIKSSDVIEEVKGGSLSFIMSKYLVNTLPAVLNSKFDNADLSLSGDGKHNVLIVNRGKETLYLYTETIDGTFPDYERVIPTGFKFSLIVSDRLEMIEKLTAIEKLKKGEDGFKKGSVVAVALKNKSIEYILDEVPQVEEVDSLRLTCEKAEDWKIGYNASYLIELLKVFDCDMVEIKLVDTAAPSLLVQLCKGVNLVDNSNLVVVLMPMRT